MKSPLNSIKNLIQDVKELGAASQNFAQSVSKLEQSVTQTQPEITELQKKIDEFNFKTKPRLDRIQELQNKMQTEINRLSQTSINRK